MVGTVRRSTSRQRIPGRLPHESPRREPGKRIISFSLYGRDPKYRNGALENVRLARQYYPGWMCRFYVSQEVPAQLIRALADAGAEVRRRRRTGCFDGTFWRFEPAEKRP